MLLCIKGVNYCYCVSKVLAIVIVYPQCTTKAADLVCCQHIFLWFNNSTAGFYCYQQKQLYMHTIVDKRIVEEWIQQDGAERNCFIIGIPPGELQPCLRLHMRWQSIIASWFGYPHICTLSMSTTLCVLTADAFNIAYEQTCG